jgi:hypothetical protein
MEKQIKIRQNVFETNSSSTHSLTINENNYDELYDTIPLTNGKIILTGGRYDYSGIIDSAIDKLNYLFTFIYLLGEPDSYYNKEDIIQADDLLSKVILLITNQTGVREEDIIFSPDDSIVIYDDNDFAYQELFKKNDSTFIKEFIFNKNYQLELSE